MNISETQGKKQELFRSITYLSVSELRGLFRRLFREGLDGSQVDVIEEELFKAKYNDKYGHAVRWMENRLEREPELTPYKLALVYVGVTSGNKRLLPFYIKLARKVKDRFRKRSRS